MDKGYLVFIVHKGPLLTSRKNVQVQKVRRIVAWELVGEMPSVAAIEFYHRNYVLIIHT